MPSLVVTVQKASEEALRDLTVKPVEKAESVGWKVTVETDNSFKTITSSLVLRS